MALYNHVIIVVPDISCFCAKPRVLKLLKVHNGNVKSRTLNYILQQGRSDQMVLSSRHRVKSSKRKNLKIKEFTIT